ncbi:hypothetical protein Tco_1125174 [Tanacetum coccineum]|uniref:Uncharacterized protein n=1 Tax=Tanacetum coccineum TaxID=301880 RepID=A0ABQ5JCB3_9ASTR
MIKKSTTETKVYANSQGLRVADGTLKEDQNLHGNAKIKFVPKQFWDTVKAKTVNGEVQLQALVDGKKIIITKSIVRRDLQLEDAEGVDCLPNATIFKQIALMGYEQVLQVFLDKQLEGMSNHNRIYVTPPHIKKIFRNMRRVGKGFSERETPLFPTMVVHNQEEIGKGSAIPTDPHHTPTFIQPSPQPQKTQKPRRPKKKDTQVPQSSVPSDNVADEAIYKELDDSLVMAATIASSLEVEQDIGGGPRCQETMGDTIAQTSFKNESKLSNDLLLARGNTLLSGEDSLKLNELMELCTNLQQRVLDLETTKTTQANEITSLKNRVEKLEKKDRSRTYKLKRLYKVGLSARVESSRDEEDLGKNASKHERRIHDINVDEDITLVNDDNEIFDVDALVGEEVVVMIDAARTIPVSVATITDVEQVKPMKRLEQMRLDEELAFKLQAKEEEERLAREKAQQIEEANIAWDDVHAKVEADYQIHFAAKRAEEKRIRPPTRAQQRNIMTELVEESSKKAETELEENLKKAEAEVMEGSSKRAGTELEQEIKELMGIVLDKEKVVIDAIPLAVKPPSIVDWKIHKKGKKTYYRIIRADGSLKMSTRPEEGYEKVLWGDLKTMFEPYVEDQLKEFDLLKLDSTRGILQLGQQDASKQGRIDAIDANEEITLVSVQNVDEEMFDVNVLDVSVVGNVVSTASDATTVSAATTTTATITIVVDITLAQALIEIKSTKHKEKGVVIQELGESTITISSQLSSQQSQDKCKGILIEPMKPMKKKYLIRLDEEAALKLQAEFDKEERLAREKAKKKKKLILP